MNQTWQNDNPYATTMNTFAVDARLSERLSFLRKVYGHVFAGILVLIGLEYLYMTTGIGRAIFSLFGQMWWAALLGIIAVNFVAVRLAVSGASLTTQYVGYGLYILVESVFIAPAIAFAMLTNPDLIGQAAFLTIGITGALTLFVVMSNKDFSFLRNALFLASISLFIVGICSIFFGFSVGIVFSGLVVALMCGYILYETSVIMHHLPTTAHVAGALMIFGSMTEMFKHLIYLLSYLNED